MTARSLSILAMATAGVMLGHQVAGKAVRDAMFLGAWPASALPVIVVATAVTAVIAVPLYAWLLGRLGPRIVVPAGFTLSAAAHLVEWQVAGASRAGAVAVYLHVAGFGALLLSGFWSLTSELFDPRSAKASYGRIAAAGTLGGLAGGLVTARLATAWPPETPLLFLAILHGACAIGVLWLGRTAVSPRVEIDTGRPSGLFRFDALRQAPHLKTLALLVVTGTAGAAIVDFLLKAEAASPEHFGSRAELLQFFSLFYTIVQVLTFVVQSNASRAVARLGLGRTISTLPLGLGLMSIVALLYPTMAVFAVVRAVEAVLRGSMFRSGYELLFVPMDPDEKRRTKTFLDVTCDRAGDAIGALVVWLVLLTGAAFQHAELVAATAAFAFGGVWLARRLDGLYVNVVERHLVKQGDQTPVVVGSETGWSIIDIPTLRQDAAAEAPPAPVVRPDDRRLGVLAALRSGDRTTVQSALTGMAWPTALEVAQAIQLLAWDDVAVDARRVLERAAPLHIGLLTDALLDPDTDFAIRRRIARVLGTVASERALVGLAQALTDPRFEVRYQAARAIDRILARDAGLTVVAHTILAAVDRELSVPLRVWQGHHLIDRLDADDTDDVSARRQQRNVEHVFTLLSAVLPREPIQVAHRGIQSDEAGLRALAIEYLDSVLPPEIRTKLWGLLEAAPLAHRESVTPDEALERLRRSAEMPRVRNGS